MSVLLLLLLLILSKWLYSRNLVGCLFDAKPCAVIAIQFDYFKITIQLPITKFSVLYTFMQTITNSTCKGVSKS
jgi:hypothetical protein